MRITFIVASLWLSGGERIILEYANRLSDRGHQIVLVAPGETVDPEMVGRIKPAVKLIQTKIPGNRKMFLATQVALTIELACRVPQSDIVITTYTPVTPAGWIASRLLKRGKLIWLFMDFAEAFENRPLYLQIAHLASKYHDAILTISNYLKEELISWGSKCPITVVGLALSESKYYYPPMTSLPDSQKTQAAILYLGDTRPRKGLKDFLTACEIVYQHYPETEFWICLKDMASVPTSFPCRFFHRPTHEELARLYSSCGVFVSSSWREGFSLPPLEAMACGAPVVMTDSGGNREYAKHRENSLVVPSRQPELLAKAIIEVLGNPELAQRLRQQGPIMAAEFNWTAVMNRFENALFGFTRS